MRLDAACGHLEQPFCALCGRDPSSGLPPLNRLDPAVTGAVTMEPGFFLPI
jgi:hypothetical protein